jgi:hypothetical protein
MSQRASFMARVSHPDLTAPACREHDLLMQTGFTKIINEDVTPSIRARLKLPSSMAGVNCPLAIELAMPAFTAARATAISSFIDDPAMLSFMGITSAPHPASSSTGMPAEGLDRPPDPGPHQPAANAVKDQPFSLKGKILDELERLRDLVVSPLVKIVKGHIAPRPSQSQPAGDSQQDTSAQNDLPSAAGSSTSAGALLDFSSDSLRHIPLSLPSLLQLAGQRSGKLQHSLMHCVNRVSFHQLFCSSTDLERSRILSQSHRGANAWIEASPLDHTLTLTDREFLWAMRYRLGSETLRREDVAIACRCLDGKPPGSHVSLTHMSSCKFGGGAIKRHDTVVNQIFQMLRASGMRARLEPRAQHDFRPAFGKGGPDIQANDAGRDFFVEIMIKDQSQPSLLSKSSSTPRVAAAVGEAEKRDKYFDKATSLNYDLIPATFEEAGAFSKSSLELIHICARAAFRNGRIQEVLGNPWPAHTFSGYWTQRLSVALRKGCFLMREKILRAEASRV